MQNKFQAYKQLARNISIVENELSGYEELLENLKTKSTPVVGITGAPGAGKSTLTNALVREYVKQNKRVAILAIDPSSPFNFGSLLGDRVRMAEHFNSENVFIRSLASRGSLGGLCEKILEICDVVKAANFDLIIVETVGVGQSEVEIAGLADITIVALTPAAGDEVQNMKAGLMEVADIFVVNKSDMPNAEGFIKNLELLIHERFHRNWQIPVVKTIATENVGIVELQQVIEQYFNEQHSQDKKLQLLTDKALRLIQQRRMKGFDKQSLKKTLQENHLHPDFNFYKLIKELA
ncbi:MAG: methylmalonyl Co-A mutase-associated GTPase MeaB [Bacteroidota bacterium]